VWRRSERTGITKLGNEGVEMKASDGSARIETAESTVAFFTVAGARSGVSFSEGVQ
jgi:hypothetical protein